MQRHYIIRGRVQGVGFRWFAAHEAKSLGLTGWVRNRVDGDVEALACGSEAQLEVFKKKLREGSRGSRVDSVQESEAESHDDPQTFRIEGAW